MKKVLKSLFTNWKTSVAGILIGVLTTMLWLGRITVTDWSVALGVAGTAVGLLAKDWNKTDQP